MQDKWMYIQKSAQIKNVHEEKIMPIPNPEFQFITGCRKKKP